MPKAYIVGNVSVHDADAYARYRERATSMPATQGGRYLVRGGKVESLEGDFGLTRVVILEFPSREAALAWYDGPEYRELRKERQASTSTNLVLVEGVE